MRQRSGGRHGILQVWCQTGILRNLSASGFSTLCRILILALALLLDFRFGRPEPQLQSPVLTGAGQGLAIWRKSYGSHRVRVVECHQLLVGDGVPQSKGVITTA